MRKLIQLIVLALFLVVFSIQSSANPKPGDPEYVNITPNNPEIQIGEEYSDWAYSAEFAKRFKLDENKVEEMTPGLFAVEFRLLLSHNIGKAYECSIDLYLDKDVNIQFPEMNRSGNLNEVKQLNRKFPFMNRSESDKSTYVDEFLYDVSATNKFVIEPFTDNFEGQRVIKIESYRKDVFSGINFLSLSAMNCSEVLPPQYGFDILLRKIGVMKYQADFTQKDVVRISIPKALHQRICPYIEKAAYLSLNKLLKNTPNLRELYRVSKGKMNNYPLGCQ